MQNCIKLKVIQCKICNYFCWLPVLIFFILSIGGAVSRWKEEGNQPQYGKHHWGEKGKGSKGTGGEREVQWGGRAGEGPRGLQY